MQALGKHSIAILLFDGVMALDVTGPTDALMVANYYWRKKCGHKGDEVFYDFFFVASKDHNTRTLSGLTLHADKTLKEQSPYEAQSFLVPGGNGVFDAARDRQLISWISEAHKYSKRTLSVCSGSWLLAEAGVLQGHTSCTHWTMCKRLAEQYPDVKVDPEAIYLADDKIVTSAGVTSGIDMTLALIEADMGRDIALKVARRLVVHLKRPGNQSQYSWPLKAQAAVREDSIGRAVRWVLDNITEPMNVEYVAEQAGMSLRSFNRHFKEQLGDSPAKFIEQARLENARLMIEENTNISLAHAADASGFSSTEHLTRAFERRFGVHPSSYRQTFALA